MKETLSLIRSNYLPIILIFIVAILPYLQSKNFDYAWDDKLYVNNSFIQEGWDGFVKIFTQDGYQGLPEAGRPTGKFYRPIPMAIFAAEQAVWGESPGKQHIVNAFFHAVTALLLFFILVFFFPIHTSKRSWYLSIPFIATLLFVVHPVISEAVVNLKNRDLVLGALFALLSLWLFLQYSVQDKKGYLWWLLASFAYFLSLLCKAGYTAPFLVLTPLAIYIYHKKLHRTIGYAFVGVLIPHLLALGIRSLVIGKFSVPLASSHSIARFNTIAANPFLDMSFSEKYASIVFSMGYYLKLLFLPYPLTHNYAVYHFPIMNWGDISVILSLIINGILVGLTVWLLLKRHFISFALLFYFASLSTALNIVGVTGSIVGERHTYLPLMGFCMIVAYLLVRTIPNKLGSKGDFVKWLYIPIVILFFALTYQRLPAWQNDETLFLTDVKVSKNSAGANLSAGFTYGKKAEKATNTVQQVNYVEKAYQHLKKSVDIYPGYGVNLQTLAAILPFVNRPLSEKIISFKKVIQSGANDAGIYDKLDMTTHALQNEKERQAAVQFYQQLIQLDKENYLACQRMARLYQHYSQDCLTAIQYYNQALERNAEDMASLLERNKCYRTTGTPDLGLPLSLAALEKNPYHRQLLQDIILNYQELGEMDKASIYEERLGEL